MKKLLKKVLYILPVRIRIFVNFIYRLHYIPNLSRPQTFSEKIQYLKLNWNDRRLVALSDKLAVRNYVSEKLSGDSLIPLIKVCDELCSEELQALAKSHNGIVLKTNHSSGGVRILDDNVSVGECQEAINFILADLLIDYGRKSGEPWYGEIDRKVFVEKMLKGEDGNPPADYKVHVFKNKGSPVLFLQVDYDRFVSHKRTFYDENLNVLPIQCQYPNDFRAVSNDFASEVFGLAKILAEGFDYCRVDFYVVNGKVYFGEMTFAHGSGYERFFPRSVDVEFGKLWG